MKKKRRLISFLEKKLSKIKTKYFLFQQDIALTLIFIFGSFFFGNFFANLITNLKNYLKWDFFIVLIFLLFLELINLITYSKNFFIFQFLKIKINNLIKLLNSAKIGFLLALFIDAFKVGS
jgi:hypothetical protein